MFAAGVSFLPYEVSIGIENFPGFERRFAGRMENGGNLISDPAMGT